MSSQLSVLLFSSRRRHTRLQGDWSSDVCSSDLETGLAIPEELIHLRRADGCAFPPDGRIFRALQGLKDFRRLHLHHVEQGIQDRKSTRLNSSHLVISYAVFCLKKNSHTHPRLDA